MTDRGISRKVYSTSSVRALHAQEDLPKPKDVLYSWVVCFAVCFVQVIIVGILNSFGVIFVELREEFKVSKAELSWIASLAFGVSLALGPLAGTFRLRFGARVAICLGGISCAISLLASSFVPNTKYLFGTFSLLYAIGGGLVINSTTILAPDYFDRYVSVATGIVVAGGSLGTLLFTCLGEVSVKSLGWRNTFRIYSGISLLTTLLGLVIRPVHKPPPRRSTINDNQPHEAQTTSKVRLWENKAYVVWVLCITCAMFGYFVPYVHLISFAIDIGLSKESGSALIMILGGTSALARLLFGKVLSFQFLNKRQIYQLSMMITATSTMMLPISTSMGALVVYAIVQGILDGCNVVLVPLLTRIYAGDTKVPIAWGILNGVSSITFTLGPPVAGWLSDATGSYNVSFHIAGIPMIAAAGILFFIPWAQHTTNKRTHATERPDTVSNPNNTDTFTAIEPGLVIVGLPITDTTTSLSRAGEPGDSRILNNLPTESEILNESRWSWSSIHRTSSIEIPTPNAENTLHKTVSSRGIQIRLASEESDSGFVIVEKTEIINDSPQHRVQHEALGEEPQRVNSPVVLDSYVVETLVELNEGSEIQPKCEELVQLNENSRDAATSSERVEGTVSLTEENDKTEDNTGVTVVIPDYVVEKLVELNENEQNKSNSEAVVDTLVDLSDDENDIDKIAIDSGSNRILESEEQKITENKIDQRHPPNAGLSHQSSDSQCIIPSSVVETLENLAQSSKEYGLADAFKSKTDLSLWQADSSSAHCNSSVINHPTWGTSPGSESTTVQDENHQTQTDLWDDCIHTQTPANNSAKNLLADHTQQSPFYGQSEISCQAALLSQSNNGPIQANFNSTQTNDWQSENHRSSDHGGSHWNTEFAQSQTVKSVQGQNVTMDKPFNTHTSLGHIGNQWDTDGVQSQTIITDQYQPSVNLNPSQTDTRQSSNNNRVHNIATDQCFKAGIPDNLNSVKTETWQSSNDTNAGKGWIQCNATSDQSHTDSSWSHGNSSEGKSQTGYNSQSETTANGLAPSSAQIDSWQTFNNGNAECSGIQWNAGMQPKSASSNNFNPVQTEEWQQSQSCDTEQVGVHLNTIQNAKLQNVNDTSNTPIQTELNFVQTERHADHWTENSVKLLVNPQDQLLSSDVDRVSSGTAQWTDHTAQWIDHTTQWMDHTTRQFPPSITPTENVNSTVNSLLTFTTDSIYHHSQSEISNNVNHTSVFDVSPDPEPTSTGDEFNRLQSHQSTQSGYGLRQTASNDWWTDISHTGQTLSSSHAEQHKVVTWSDPVSEIYEPETSGSSPNCRQFTDSYQHTNQNDQIKTASTGCSELTTENTPSQIAVDNDTLTTFDQLWVDNQSTDPDKDKEQKT